MKKVSSVIVCASLLFTTFISCSKSDNDGLGAPENPVLPGSTALASDVILFNYGSKSFVGGMTYSITGISQGKIDSSVVLAYYNEASESASSWYPVPGYGPEGAYETRSFFSQTSSSPLTYSYAVRLQNPVIPDSGIPDVYIHQVTFTKFRIFIIPASTVIAGGRNAAIDFSDYHAVCKHYNIPE